MKKICFITFALITSFCITLTSCSKEDNKCHICHKELTASDDAQSVSFPDGTFRVCHKCLSIGRAGGYVR